MRNRAPNATSRARFFARVSAVFAFLFVFASATAALAAPPSGSASTSGKASTNSGAKGSGSSSGYEPPEFVYGGNAIQLQVPFQIGLVAYQPRARIGLQYDRQIYKTRWVHIGAAALLDNGNFRTFRMDDCGITAAGACQRGTVAGLDVYLGYTHKFFVKKKPWIVPTLHASLGGGFWKLPNIGGVRQQDRTLSWYLLLRLGGGVRFFLLQDLAIGLDLSIDPGFAVHRRWPEGNLEGDYESKAQFLLGLETLLALEYRF